MMSSSLSLKIIVNQPIIKLYGKNIMSLSILYTQHLLINQTIIKKTHIQTQIMFLALSFIIGSL